ncbi:MAG: nicotinate (nicotinamide) nucleotide adenylyltransferase [Polyangiales bacterium]
MSSHPPKERIAVYGGSFDPPHVGHFLVSAWVATSAPIDRLLLVPTYRHALGKGARASFEHRVAMCGIVASLLPRTEVSALEATLGEPSRTLHTLEALSEAHPDAELRLVVGADIAAETHRWHRWDAIEAIAPPLWVGRVGYPRPPGASVDFPAVSSTEIRARLENGESVDGLVPNEVLAYLRAHGLYGGSAP